MDQGRFVEVPCVRFRQLFLWRTAPDNGITGCLRVNCRSARMVLVPAPGRRVVELVLFIAF